ncbi:hypothetical protein M0Q28_05235 [Patescibacteria group bacterium]|jgi:hypothetical protein|nr:hypothetical protein [Patescibacteria group bacterium]
MGRDKKSKIEKLIKKQKVPRTFHPAIRLLEKADRELFPIMALAAELGISFVDTTRSDGHFQASALHLPGEARAINIFAELERMGHRDDVRFGVSLIYYQTVGHRRAIADITLSRLFSEGEWVLECVLRDGFKRPEADVSHSARRLGGSFSEKRSFGLTAGVAKVAVKMLRDYRKFVLIPRQMRST